MVTSGQQPLGQLLVEMGFIDADQLRSALESQSKSGKRLGKVLIDAGVISEDRLVHALSAQLGIEACDPIMTPIHERVLALVPPEMAFRHKVLPIARQREDSGECLYVATSDPLDKRALQAVRTVIPPTTRVRWMLAGEIEMELALARHYRPGAATDRSPPRETARGAAVPTGIPVLQGKPLAAPRGSGPEAPGVSAASSGLHAHSSTGDIFDALEEAVMRSGDVPRIRLEAPPSPPPAILRSTGDLALADPSRWTGGDLSAPASYEPDPPPLHLGTADLVAAPPSTFDLPLDLDSVDVEPPDWSDHRPVPVAPPDFGAMLSDDVPVEVEEVIDGEPLSEDFPELEELAPEPEPAPLALSAPPVPSTLPPLERSPRPSASTPEAGSSPSVAAFGRPGPFPSAPPSSGSSPSAPAFSGGSSWGDLLDDPNPHSTTATLRPLSVAPEYAPAVEVEVEEVDADEPGVQNPPEPEPEPEDRLAFQPEPPADPEQLPELAHPELNIEEVPEAEGPGNDAGTAEPGSDRWPTNALDVPERSALLDTGEEAAEDLGTPIELSEEGSERPFQLTPVADFLQMAEVAGVSGHPTTIPESVADEDSVELHTFAGPLSALVPGLEDLPDASADVEVAEEERRLTTADLLARPARATEVRDLLLRFIAGEDQEPETQRYVVRLLASMLLGEGMLDDDRLLDALDRLR